MFTELEISTLGWNGLSFFLGLILGHRLNLWRERRKEFNELSAKVKDWLVVSNDRKLDFTDLDLPLRRAFFERLSGSEGRRFGKAIKILREEFLYIRGLGNAGYVITRRPEEVNKAFDDFKRITRLR